MATGLLVENGRLVGLKLAETQVEGRRAELIPGTEYELRAPLVISSIGSVPEVIPGVAMTGEYYTFSVDSLPRYIESDRVFGVGNVVTGQGNIRVSLVHSQKVTTQLVENYLGVRNGNRGFSAFYAATEAKAAARANSVVDHIRASPPLSRGEIAALEQRIRALQARVGYSSDYNSWIAKVTPPDLE